MKQDTQLIVKEAMTGASKGALIASAASIVGGVAMVSTPSTSILWGLITFGASSVVALPVVASVAVGGAVVGGAAAAIIRHNKNKKIHKQFENLHGKK
jgi:uncharacterized membrane protein